MDIIKFGCLGQCLYIDRVFIWLKDTSNGN